MENSGRKKVFLSLLSAFVVVSSGTLLALLISNHRLLDYNPAEDSSNLMAVDLDPQYLAEDLDYLDSEVFLADEGSDLSENDQLNSSASDQIETNNLDSEQDVVFLDLNPNDQAFEEITHLANIGIINGYEDGSFRPDNLISRAEFIAVLANFFEVNTQYENCFFDVVDRGFWYQDLVCSAYDLGLISGYEDGSFRPDENITKAEALALAIRVFELDVDASQEELENSYFLDVSPDDWFYNISRIGYERDLIAKNDYFNFDYLMTRRDVAKLIFKLIH